MLADDLNSTIFNPDEFASTATYIAEDGTQTSISVMEEPFEVDGGVVNAYDTPYHERYTDKGRLVLEGVTYGVINVNALKGVTTLVLGDAL